MLTLEELESTVPKQQRHLVDEDLLKSFNEVVADETISDEFKSNFVTFSNILKDSKNSVKEYKSAIHFVTLLLLENSDIDSYMKTFPERYARLISKGLSRSKISPYSTNYKKTELVKKLLEQTMIPSTILNAGMYQEALNHQKYLMLNAKSETVQQKAADSIMVQLKPESISKLEIDVAIKKDKTVEDNEAFMRELAEEKIRLMELGGDVKTITNMTVNKAEVIDVDIEEKE